MVLSLPPQQHFPTFNCKEKVWITEYEPGIASCCVFSGPRDLRCRQRPGQGGRQRQMPQGKRSSTHSLSCIYTRDLNWSAGDFNFSNSSKIAFASFNDVRTDLLTRFRLFIIAMSMEQHVSHIFIYCRGHL